MNKEYHLSINIYLEQNIVSFHIWKFTIDFDELQNNLKIDISIAQQQYQ